MATKQDNTNVAIYKLEVICKTRKNHATGKEFKTYAVKTKEDKWFEARFTTDVPKIMLPVSHSYITVAGDKMNVDKRNEYPKVWIREVLDIEQIERPIEDLGQYFES